MISRFAQIAILFFSLHAAGLEILAAEPPSGVLVLKNGEVLTGGITQEGDRYIVTRGDGGEVRLPIEQVDLHCRTIEEAYQRKCAALTSGVNSRLDLVEWCLRQSLYGEAADQLLQALAIDRTNRRIPLLERRLRMALEQPAPTATVVSTAPSQIDIYELEQVVRELPEATVEAFTANIQPLLMNRCGAGACHGPGTESNYRLVRPTWGKTLPRRFTQRNLHATLQQIDREHPEDSMFLIAPSQPHGTLAAPVFGANDQDQFRSLLDWVQQVTTKRKASAPATIAPPSSRLIQASYQQPVGLPAIGIEGDSPSSASQGGPLNAEGADLQDPFDPEPFNRRFRRNDSSPE